MDLEAKVSAKNASHPSGAPRNKAPEDVGEVCRQMEDNLTSRGQLVTTVQGVEEGGMPHASLDIVIPCVPETKEKP
jgi:hypothetical protein